MRPNFKDAHCLLVETVVQAYITCCICYSVLCSYILPVLSFATQAVFEALLKTMPCVWRDKTIVVLDYVHVAEPYTEDMCSADADHQATLNRVKKVLSAERVKLGLETH